jgi:hypothetical protein
MAMTPKMTKPMTIQGMKLKASRPKTPPIQATAKIRLA